MLSPNQRQELERQRYVSSPRIIACEESKRSAVDQIADALREALKLDYVPALTLAREMLDRVTTSGPDHDRDVLAACERIAKRLCAQDGTQRWPTSARILAAALSDPEFHVLAASRQLVKLDIPLSETVWAMRRDTLHVQQMLERGETARIDISLVTRLIEHILTYTAGNMLISAEPGVDLDDLAKELLEWANVRDVESLAQPDDLGKQERTGWLRRAALALAYSRPAALGEFVPSDYDSLTKLALVTQIASEALTDGRNPGEEYVAALNRWIRVVDAWRLQSLQTTRRVSPSRWNA
jgi:hypothetical protein